MICHCTDCQTLSGSAFRIVAFTREDGFRLLSGELENSTSRLVKADPTRTQAFCPECGTPIFSGPCSEKERKFTASAWARSGSVTSSCQKRSSGFARRNAGSPNSASVPSDRNATRLQPVRRSHVRPVSGALISGHSGWNENRARNDLISDATKSANARTRGACCMSRCMSKIIGRHQADTLDHTDKLFFVVALKGEERREPLRRTSLPAQVPASCRCESLRWPRAAPRSVAIARQDNARSRHRYATTIGDRFPPGAWADRNLARYNRGWPYTAHGASAILRPTRD